MVKEIFRLSRYDFGVCRYAGELFLYFAVIQTECVSTPAASPVAKLHSTSAALLTVSDQSWRITSARRATLLLVTNNRAVKELSRKFHNIPRRPLKGQLYRLL